jgi:hypothetical protein
VAVISLLQETKEVEMHVAVIIAAYGIDTLDFAQRELFATIKRQIVDARLDVRDYEYADTRAEQLSFAIAGKQRLDQIRRNIVKASEQGLFSAIDVAQLSANLEIISEQLS